jgi:hypothetical protein
MSALESAGVSAVCNTAGSDEQLRVIEVIRRVPAARRVWAE